MMPANRTQIRILMLAMSILLLLPGTTTVRGQTKQLLNWKENLNSLQNLPDSELQGWQDIVGQIRTGVDFWLQLHPNTPVELPDAPPQPWNADQVQAQISTLKETVATLLKLESLRPFELGVTAVTVTSELSPLSPVADSVDGTTIEKRHATDVTQAFQYLPGVTIDYKPSRNQSGVVIRGFDTRQVGLYLDNIPIYVPYDGYADMGRFLTSEVAEIQVAKGYSSPLVGPNGLGGAVNIVTRQPEKQLEGVFTMGTGSGDMAESSLHAGSNPGPFIFQGGIDLLKTDYYPVAGDFESFGIQPTYDRTNSDSRDLDFNGRAGYVPNDRDQYIFSFLGQRSEYGAPPYAGTAENPKYWRWPNWDRESYYINIGKGLGRRSALAVRMFYDEYRNQLEEFNGPKSSDLDSLTQGDINGLYSDMKNFTTNEDHSLGGSAEFSTLLFSRHFVSASFFLKDDAHTHYDTLTTEDPYRVKPSVNHRDRLLSIGLQDSIALTRRLHAIAGFSVDNMNGYKAQNFYEINEGTNKNPIYTFFVTPFDCAGTVTENSFPGCIDEWSFNPLASVSYSITNSGTFFASFALKSHMPTMKDRYDYKRGKAIPNPTLQPEYSRNWGIGYSHVFPRKTLLQIELFRSDVYDAIEKTFIPEPIADLCTESKLAGYCEYAINVGKELHHGVELNLRSSAFSRTTLDFSYSYLSRSVSGPDEMPPVYPTGTPKHKIVGTGYFMLQRDISLTATIRYENGNIGDFVLNEDNSIELMPGSNFATVDLAGILPLYGGVQLQAGANNLFDKYYYYREGYPRAGRNWFFNMKYKF